MCKDCDYARQDITGDYMYVYFTCKKSGNQFNTEQDMNEHCPLQELEEK